MRKLFVVLCALTMLCNVCFANAEQVTCATCVCERVNTMPEVKNINGYNKEDNTPGVFRFVDAEAREDIAALSKEKMDKHQGVENSKLILYVGEDGNTALLKSGDEIAIKTAASKNIVYGEWESGKFDVDKGGQWVSSSTVNNYGINEKFPVVPGATYTISHGVLLENLSTAALYVLLYDEEGEYISQITYAIRFNTKLSAQFTVTENTHFISIYVFQKGADAWQDALPTNFMIELGNKATEYEPYRSINQLALDEKKAYDKMAGAGLLPERMPVPGYYHNNNYINTKCARIRELLDGCAADGDAFMFVTDQHWELNAGQSPALMRYIAQNVNIPRVFSGGDMGNNDQELYANLLAAAFSGDIHHAMGNHDFSNGMNGNKLAYICDMGKRWQIGNAKRHYYYVDNPQQEIRYVVLATYTNDSGTVDTAYDAEQVAWLRDVALDVEAGWTVIVFTHSLYYCYGTDATPRLFPTGASDIQTVLDEAQCDIACVLQGHAHLDRIVHTPGGIPVVLTVSDKYFPWMDGETDKEPWLTESRTPGTITEQAFDVVVLDKAQRKLTFVRIGAPADNWVDGTTTGTVEERVVTY